MLKQPTLFVAGAGASKEFGLPVGGELASQISISLDIRFGEFGQSWEGQGDRQIFSVIQQAAREQSSNVNDFLHACWLVRDGIQLSYSIDNFLDKHAHEPKVQHVGRLAIVKRILEAERASKLFVKPDNTYNTINFQGLADTWIVALFKMIQDRVRLDAVSTFFQDVRIITFNYDRCIEHFFFHALKRNYGIGDREAAEVMRGLEIMHAYGRVGRLPWEGHSSEPEVAFGEGDRAPLALLWPGIRTYADDRSDGQVVETIQEWVRQSDLTVFLGFSYQERNMDLLGETPMRTEHTVLGSTYGISNYNAAAIQSDVIERFGEATKTIMTPETCGGLLNTYSRLLA
jgi:hypothetical protein